MKPTRNAELGTRNWITRGVIVLMLVFSCVVLTGCEAVGFVAQVITGPEKIPAVYELADRPTVVLVDDPSNLLPDPTLATLLAGRAGESLVENEVVTQVIPPVMVERLRAAHDDFDKWGIDDVGKQTGAEQVIYVLVQECGSTEDDLIFRPTIIVRVKVIDSATGDRLFPSQTSAIGKDGHPLKHTNAYRDMQGASAATRAILMRQLTEGAADALAKLFYTHKAPELGSGLPG